MKETINPYYDYELQNKRNVNYKFRILLTIIYIDHHNNLCLGNKMVSMFT